MTGKRKTKRTKLGKSLETALKQAIEHAKGEHTKLTWTSSRGISRSGIVDAGDRPLTFFLREDRLRVMGLKIDYELADVESFAVTVPNKVRLK